MPPPTSPGAARGHHRGSWVPYLRGGVSWCAPAVVLPSPGGHGCLLVVGGAGAPAGEPGVTLAVRREGRG